MTKRLEVWLFDDYVGALTRLDGRLNFRYATAWLERADAIPLLCSLPLQAEPFDDRASRPFFAGLLPEGDKRKLIARTLQVSR